MPESRRPDRRSEIVKAAYRVLSERGYEATSIKDIAKAADIAPGLIHYYFATKEDLLVAVVEEANTIARNQFATLREGDPGGRDLATAAFDLSLARLRSHPHDYRLRLELFAVGLHNPAVRRAVARVLAARRAGMEATVRAVGTVSDTDADAVAALLAAAFDGIAMHALADPTYDPARPYRMLAEMARLSTAPRAARRTPARRRAKA
jgi:AcrR family transcriptional regulator